MEAISETKWDLVLSGTGLAQSLLALALSRSDKKILHADQNEYYGGAEAALSLQDAEDWVKKINEAERPGTFQDASISKPEHSTTSEEEGGKYSLGFSRSYSLALAPQIIYARSTLLSILVSSKTYRQLEFLAVGSWWIYDGESHDEFPARSSSPGILRKIPASREDIFGDNSIDVKSKRSLIKFVRFVTDPEAQAEALQEHGELSFGDYLSSYYDLPSRMQAALHALTLSSDPPSRTKVAYALPRITRHLASFGVFGRGFNAVVPKWGGAAEIAQVACRAGAVGGTVYMLGRALKDARLYTEGEEIPFRVSLQDEGDINAKLVAGRPSDLPAHKEHANDDDSFLARGIFIVSAPLDFLFPPGGDDAPRSSGAVVTFPHSVFTDTDVPIYIIAHSGDTSECPQGQTVLYASAHIEDGSAFEILDRAVKKLLGLISGDNQARILWKMHYRQQIPRSKAPGEDVESTLADGGMIAMPEASVDLAFDDSILKSVKDAWETVTGLSVGFMQFEDREIGAYDDEDDQT